MARDEGLTPGDSTQGENAIAAVARRMADCIERLPDDVVASFESTDVAKRVSRLKGKTNEISLGMAPVVGWLERRRAADAAALLKDRLYFAIEEAITCSSCDIPEYSGGAICKTDDLASDGACRTAKLMVVAKLLADSLRGWADDIEFEDTQRFATSTTNAERPLDGTTESSGWKEESGSPEPVAQSESGSVLLFGRQDNPIVKGNEKGTLTNAQYDVVQTLLNTGDKGLTKDALDRESKHGDARKILQRLADSDPDWKDVIPFPGTTGKGYRIL